MHPRTVLFLQGPPSAFWTELGDACAAAGRRVRKVHFSLGDRLFWHRGGSVSYRGRLSRWEAWLTAHIAREGVSDIVYYADRFPYHAIAERVAVRLGIRAWTTEFGYLRPDWLTFEPLAMGKRSRFPKDPKAIRALAEGVPDPDTEPLFAHSFWRETTSEVAWNLLNLAGRPIYPLYVSEKYYPPLLDYASWLMRLTRQGREERAARACVEQRVGGDAPFMVVALQLQSDYQIRVATDYGHIEAMLDEILGAFARCAPADLRLVVKQHPLDNGWENWPKRTARLAARHGVDDRVEVIQGGNLRLLTGASAGMITANSTAAVEALRQHRPVIALGAAIYDLPGLTHQSGLETFFSAPQAPEPEVTEAFLRAVSAHLQVRGSFYNAAGRRAATAEIARRINLPDLYFRCHRQIEGT
ncbi:MAG: capsular biosynthesis protein [Pseudomonadota bacterium]